VSSKKEVEAIAKIMEEAVQLEVPNKVDAETGKNWGDSMS
jgi:DNA polymerase I-like protein with 3'-5' exonuclease and polymerase domains